MTTSSPPTFHHQADSYYLVFSGEVGLYLEKWRKQITGEFLNRLAESPQAQILTVSHRPIHVIST